MALSGTVNGSVTYNSSYFTFYFTWSAVQNTVGNYSDVTVKTYLKTNNKYRTFDSVSARNHSITINGETTSVSKAIAADPWSSDLTLLIQEATTRVYHNADGTKSITISARSNGRASSYGYSDSTASSGDATASATITLDPINRYYTQTLKFAKYTNGTWVHFDTKTYSAVYGSNFAATNAGVTTPTGYYWGGFDAPSWTVVGEGSTWGRYYPNTYTQTLTFYKQVDGSLTKYTTKTYSGTYDTTFTATTTDVTTPNGYYWGGFAKNSWTVTGTGGTDGYFYPNTYTITYDANGGTGAPSSTSFKFETTAYISSTIPSKTGYTFKGWKQGNTTLQPGAAIPKGWGNTTLTAQWEVNSYTQTLNFYKNQNGNWVKFDTKTYSANYGTTFTPSTSGITTPTGYSFSSWDTTSWTVTGEASTNARYNPNSYKQTLNFYKMKDGSWELYTTKEYSADYDTTFTATTDDVTTPDGYYWDGFKSNSWIVSGSGSTDGYYRPNTYTVTYDCNGGSSIDDTTFVYDTTSYITNNIPLRDGYIFTGWKLNNTVINAGGQIPIGNKDITLVAQWESNTYYKINNSWVRGVLYIKENGVWQESAVHFKENNTWN